MNKHIKRARKVLDQLYAELPKIECQGKCQEACGPIMMSGLEQARINEACGGQHVNTMRIKGCPLLKEGHCSVYEVRPMICRLWGLVKVMACPWGCKPSRYLTDVEAHQFIQRANAISQRLDSDTIQGG